MPDVWCSCARNFPDPRVLGKTRGSAKTHTLGVNVDIRSNWLSRLLNSYSYTRTESLAAA